MSGIHSALSGAVTKELELQTLANNLANANTPGFKSSILSFEAILAKKQPEESSDTASTPSTALVEQGYDFKAGSFTRTGSDYDLAIQGEGFFEVNTSQGPRYTRNGVFTLNADGVLVTNSGDPVIGQSGSIKVDPAAKNFEVTSKGNILVDGREIDKIKVVRFEDQKKLKAVGGVLFEDESGAGSLISDEATILQGVRESSNVNIMKNMVKLIEVNRNYQTYQKVIQMKAKEDSSNSLGQIPV